MLNSDSNTVKSKGIELILNSAAIQGFQNDPENSDHRLSTLEISPGRPVCQSGLWLQAAELDGGSGGSGGSVGEEGISWHAGRGLRGQWEDSKWGLGVERNQGCSGGLGLSSVVGGPLELPFHEDHTT